MKQNRALKTPTATTIILANHCQLKNHRKGVDISIFIYFFHHFFYKKNINLNKYQGERINTELSLAIFDHNVYKQLYRFNTYIVCTIVHCTHLIDFTNYTEVSGSIMVVLLYFIEIN